MDSSHIDDLLSELDPDELPEAYRLLVVMEKAGLAGSREAAEWRDHLAAWIIFHEDPQLWIDGPRA